MWTPDALRYFCFRRPESVLVPAGVDGFTGASRAAWTATQTLQRLVWQYGPERAAAILNRDDAETRADVAAWRSLGRKAAA